VKKGDTDQTDWSDEYGSSNDKHHLIQELSMTATNSPLLHGDVTDQVIKAFFHVYNTLGYGFLEKVYENALATTLRNRGLLANQQIPIKVFFEGVLVGEYCADLEVDSSVIVEIKAADEIHPAHEAQLLNYLKATKSEVGLLLNFGPIPEFRRKILTNDRKSSLPMNPYPSVPSV
jgi:GxxExxY protein